jgi:hypothetical protein
LILAAVLVICGCSSDGSSVAIQTTAVAPGDSTAPADGKSPRVDLIGPAVAALEAKLGSPQEYFEINATSQLVNLWVALNDRTLAQAWVYVDGQLTSVEPKSAQGDAFAATALPSDPTLLMSKIAGELPGSSLDLVEIVGGSAGRPRFTVAVTSSQGGQLLVEVAADGKVVSVDPN